MHLAAAVQTPCVAIFAARAGLPEIDTLDAVAGDVAAIATPLGSAGAICTGRRFVAKVGEGIWCGPPVILQCWSIRRA